MLCVDAAAKLGEQLDSDPNVVMLGVVENVTPATIIVYVQKIPKQHSYPKQSYGYPVELKRMSRPKPAVMLYKPPRKRR